MSEKRLLAAIEAGGTSFLIAIGTSPVDIIDTYRIETTKPDETLGKVVAWLKTKKFDSIGFASFGPLDLCPNSETFGYITETPKPFWKYTDLLSPLRAAFPSVPILLDTDVNAPALAELKFGGHEDITLDDSAIYITIGTGVGVGVVVNGKPVHGLQHPEAGHVYVKRYPHSPNEASIPGTCPYHGDCVEGLLSVGAICARFGLEDNSMLKTFDPDMKESGWDAIAYYLAQLCMLLTLVVSPSVIVLGGGFMNRESITPMVHRHFEKLLNNYVNVPKVKDLKNYIKRSELKTQSGITGALLLSSLAFEHKSTSEVAKSKEFRENK